MGVPVKAIGIRSIEYPIMDAPCGPSRLHVRGLRRGFWPLQLEPPPQVDMLDEQIVIVILPLGWGPVDLWECGPISGGVTLFLRRGQTQTTFE